jgi:hypothetical protein
MAEPRPVHGMVVLTCVALGAVVLWWLALPDADRLARLHAIAHEEQAPAWPPDDFWAQPGWLVAHRWAQLEGMLGLAGLALLLGAGQGWLRRRRDPQAGFRLRLWTLGVCSLPLLAGGVACYLVLPMPVGLLQAAGVGALLAGLAGYALLAGAPAIS